MTLFRQKNISLYSKSRYNIKQIRKDKKITQEDLCARMQVLGFKLSRSDISKLENGKRFITDTEVLGFSKALRVSILDLYK